jgi:hypothetical protein
MQLPKMTTFQAVPIQSDAAGALSNGVPDDRHPYVPFVFGPQQPLPWTNTPRCVFLIPRTGKHL